MGRCKGAVAVTGIENIEIGHERFGRFRDAVQPKPAVVQAIKIGNSRINKDAHGRGINWGHPCVSLPPLHRSTISTISPHHRTTANHKKLLQLSIFLDYM
jgi:hypothetical protein